MAHCVNSDTWLDFEFPAGRKDGCGHGQLDLVEEVPPTVGWAQLGLAKQSLMPFFPHPSCNCFSAQSQVFSQDCPLFLLKDTRLGLWHGF